MDITFNNYKEYLQVNDFLEKKRIQLETVDLYNEMNSFISNNIVHLDDSTLYTEKAKEESKGFLSKVWDFLKKVWGKIVKILKFIIKKLFKHDVKIKELEAKVKKLEQAKDKDFEKAQFSDKDVSNAKAAFKEEMRLAGVKEDINLEDLADKVQNSKLDADGKEEGKKRKTVFLGAISSTLKKLPKAMIHTVIGQLMKNKTVNDLKVKNQTIKLDSKIKSVLNDINKKFSKVKKESTDFFIEDKKSPSNVDTENLGYNYYDASVDLCITLVSGLAAFLSSMALLPFWPVISGIALLLGVRCITGTGKKITLDALYNYSCIYYLTIYLTIYNGAGMLKGLMDIIDENPTSKVTLKSGESKDIHGFKYPEIAGGIILDLQKITSAYNNCKYINKEFYTFFNNVNKNDVYREFKNYLSLFGNNKLEHMLNIPGINIDSIDNLNFDPNMLIRLAESVYTSFNEERIKENISRLGDKDAKVLQSISNLLMTLSSRLVTISTNKEEFAKNNVLEIATQGLFSFKTDTRINHQIDMNNVEDLNP